MSINSKSEYQEEAWEFVKFFVRGGYNGYVFPMAKRSYTEENVNIQVYKCEPKDVEIIRNLIENISDKFYYNVVIQKITEEESSAYMQDQKSLEEVCSIIQNRVQLYLDEENRG